MFCEVKTNSINFLKKEGATDDIRRILDRDLFDNLNLKLTRLAEEKYGLAVGDQLLFDVNMSEQIDRGRSTYYRDAKITIYRAVPNDVLFDQLQVLKNQYDNKPEAINSVDKDQIPDQPDSDSKSTNSYTQKLYQLNTGNTDYFFEKPIEELDKYLLNFLKPFGVRSKEFDNLKERLGVDALGATDVLNKLIWLSKNRNVETVPEEAGHMILMLMGETNPLVKNLIDDITNWSEYKAIEKEYLPLYNNEKQVRIEAAGKLLAKALVKNYKESGLDKSLLQKALNVINEFIKKLSTVFKTNVLAQLESTDRLADHIAINVLMGNTDYIAELKSKNPRLSYEEALKNNAFAQSVISRFAKLNAKLTGSLALAGQKETVYRSSQEPIHDIDFTVDSLEDYENILDEVEKVNGVAYHYGWDNKQKDYTTYAFLIPKEGFTIEVLERDFNRGNGWITKYNVRDSKGNVVPKSAQNHTAVDFFVYKDGSNRPINNSIFTNARDVYFGKLTLSPLGNEERMFTRKKDQVDYSLSRPLTGDPSSKEFIYYQLGRGGEETTIDITPFDVPLVDIDLRTINNLRSKEVATILAKKLSNSLNANFENVTEEEAAKILSTRSLPYNGEAAFYYAGTVYIVGDNVNVDTVLHEFSHPLLQGIRQNNKKLFDNLYSLLNSTTEGKEIIELVKDRYPELGEGTDLFKEEALAWSLQRTAVNKINKQIESKGFNDYIKKLLASIKQFLRNVFGKKVNVSKLNANTSIDELADMLLEKNFEFETERVTEEDIVMYGKFVVERAKELSKRTNSEVLEQIIREVNSRNIDLLNQARNFKTDKVIRKMVEESLFKKGTTEFLPGIRSSLKGYISDVNLPNVDAIIDNAINAEERRLTDINNKAEALVNSFDTINNTVNNILSDLRKIESMPNINTRNVIALLGLYKNNATAWMETIKEIDDILAKETNLDTSNPFYQTINEIVNNLARVQRRIGKIYEKNNVQFMVEITGYMNEFVTSRLNENLGIALKKAFSDAAQLENAVLDLYNKVIDQKLTEADIEELIKKGAPGDILRKFIKEYNDFVVDEEKIKNALTGHAKDVSWFNRWLESYSSSNDVIVGPLSMFIQNEKTEIENRVWNQSMEFRKKLEKVLPKIGFNKLNVTQVRDLVASKDTIMWYDPETGKPVEKEIYTFLNEFGNGWRYQQDILEYNLEEAKKTGDKDKVAQAQQELRQFNKDYMWQEFVPEFYEKDDIFTQSEVGGLAYIARKQALDNFNNLVNQFDNELSRFENYAPIQAAWREYQQLSSLYYEDGTPKVDDPANGIYDLSIAKILSEHKQNTRDYYEFVPVEGSLQTSYNEFVNLLEINNITKGSAEFKKKIREWEKQNLRVVYSDEYYAERSRILDKIQQLQSKMNAVMDSEFNVGNAYKKISELLFSYKDEQGQPISSELGPDRLKLIRDTQQAILNYRFKFDQRSGLTKEQGAELDMLAEIAKKNPDDMTPEQEKRYVYLIKLQNAAGINPQDAIDIKEAFAELSDLSTRIPTEDYLEQLNYNLSKQNIKEVNEDEVDDFINSPEFLEMLEADKNFKDWFELNHVVKQVYDNKLRDYVPMYEKTMANSVVVPRNTKYIKTTTILDTETNQEITLAGLPNSRHSRYQVKNEYRTVPFGSIKSEYVGKYIDNKGSYLPRSFKPGDKNSAKDDRFINKEYVNMDKNSARFELLEAIKEYHLSSQDGQTNYAKLYLDVPRYATKRMDIYQVLQKGRYGERFKEISSNVKEWISQTVGRSKVDYENDLNYNPENNLVNTDLEGNRISYIPVTGIYNLDIDVTDADVLQGLFRYAMSIQTQGKLLEGLPLVDGLLTTLEDPDNQPKEISKFQKNAFNLRNKIQNVNIAGAQNNRLGQVRSLIEREYYGKQVVGMEENFPRLSKWLNVIQGLSARGSLAINISSDLKNKYSGYVQTIIEAAGGEFITMKDLALATPWAIKAMLDWSGKDIYGVGPGALSTQLVQIFDPTFRTKDEFGRSVTRSIFKDLVNGEWMYMHRKFGEMEVAMKLFGSFMYGQKIDQKLSDGTIKSIRYIDAWEKDSEGIARLRAGIHPGWNNLAVYHTYTDGETLEEIAEKYNIDVEELKAKNKIKSTTQLEDGQEIVIAKSEKFKAFKNRMQGVSRRLFGVYDEFGQPEGNKLLLYRMFFFMRKWFTSMLVNRFGMDTSTSNFGAARYDWALGKTTKGYYVSSFQTLWGLLKSKGQSYSYMTPQEKSDLRRFSSEGLMIILTALLASALLGYDDDDEDRWKKLKAKSGALLTPGYDTYGFLSNHALNLILGVQAETGAFVPLPEIFGLNLGADDYVKMITSTSSAFYNTLVLYVQILGDFFNFITFNEAARYKKDVGPYWYQQEGELKIWRRLFKTIGFTGTTGDPVTLIKNLEQSSSRIGG